MSVPSVMVEMKVWAMSTYQPYYNHNFANLTCIFQIQNNPSAQGIMPGVDTLQFEMSREALSTMLDGLTKIRDQLGSIKQ